MEEEPDPIYKKMSFSQFKIIGKLGSGGFA